MFNHLFNRVSFKEMVSFFELPDYAKDGSIAVTLKEHINYAVHNNCEIINCNYN